MKPTYINAPSAARLMAALNVTRAQANIIRGLIRGEIRVSENPLFPETAAWIDSCYHRPSRWERIMSALNEVLEGHGVECLRDGEESSWNGYAPAFEYVNMGDTYTPTLVYCRRAGTVRLCSWGDIVERNPRLC